MPEYGYQTRYAFDDDEVFMTREEAEAAADGKEVFETQVYFVPVMTFDELTKKVFDENGD